MNGGTLSNIRFQTFYVSKEESNCPIISDFIKIVNSLKKKDILKNTEIVLSHRYGRRILINSDKRKINQNDFLEIVDYDPIKNILLVIGPNQALMETPLHWFIHKSRNEINAVIQINDENLMNGLEKILIITEKEYPVGTIENIKETLKSLRKSKNIIIRNQGVLFVGSSLKEVENRILTTVEEIK
jgi:ribulose-5-phosphate 4-epimerase/fuculose-1-phosphate aldolase